MASARRIPACAGRIPSPGFDGAAVSHRRRDTASLANERRERGLTGYLDRVDAQREALKAERQDAPLRGERAVSTILLAKALGGGWERPDWETFTAK